MRVLFSAFFLVSTAQAAEVIDHVKQAHALECGVVTAINDESIDDTHGDLSALGSDMCRAVAAAVGGAHTSVHIHAFPSEALAYEALQAGGIDVIMGATPDAGLARRYNLDYLAPYFFDGVGVLVHKDRGIASLRDLAGKHVCTIGGTYADIRFMEAAHRAGVAYAPFPFQEIGEMEAALVGGRCDAEAHDISKLAAGRAAFHGRVHDFDILPDRLSLDPVAPVVRSGDAVWARVVGWVIGALVQAEISGVTSANLAQSRFSQDTLVQTLAGGRRGPQWGLFLDEGWSAQAIAAVGNYGEIYARDVGAKSPLRLERGPNQPWTQGGMLWGLPVK